MRSLYLQYEARFELEEPIPALHILLIVMVWWGAIAAGTAIVRVAVDHAATSIQSRRRILERICWATKYNPCRPSTVEERNVPL